jgi:hypothetical protein
LPTLKVNQPNDPLEQQADRVADAVSSDSVVSTSALSLGNGFEATQLDVAPSIVGEALRSNAQPLDPTTKSRMTQRFGYDFGQVRVHIDTKAAESARALDAQAYTVGRDVVFAFGRYAPDTAEGKHLIAHELAHVVQQDQKARLNPENHRTVQRKSGSVLPWGTTPTGDPQTYVVQTGDYLMKIADKFYGDAMEWPKIYAANKAIIGANPDRIFAGQILEIPVGGGTSMRCRFEVGYSNPSAIPLNMPNHCGGAIRYDITSVKANGKGCPANLGGLNVSETVVSDHGCGTPTSMSVRTGNFRLGPGGAVAKGSGDTYGIRVPTAVLPSCIDPCTETYHQNVFVGGLYAESHSIAFTMCANAGGHCACVIERDGQIMAIL